MLDVELVLVNVECDFKGDRREPRHIYGSDHPKIGLSILSRAYIRVMSFSLWRLGHFTGFEYFVSSGNQFVDKVCCLGGEEEELYMSRKKL